MKISGSRSSEGLSRSSGDTVPFSTQLKNPFTPDEIGRLIGLMTMRENCLSKIGSVLLISLSLPSICLGEDICLKESGAAAHFDSIEVEYRRAPKEKVNFDVYLWDVSPTLGAQIFVYYGVPEGVKRPENLGKNYELLVELSHVSDEDSIYAEFAVAEDFSPFLIEIRSSYVEAGLPSCGISHIFAVGQDALPQDQLFGKLVLSALIE